MNRPLHESESVVPVIERRIRPARVNAIPSASFQTVDYKTLHDL
jgi:hypothetical protein